MNEEQMKKIGASLALGYSSVGRAALKYSATRDDYRVKFYAYGLPAEKAESIVNYIEDRFAPSSLDILAALDNIQKGLASSLFNASNINTIYTTSDEVLLGNSLVLASVINRDVTLARVQSIIIAGQRAALAMKLDRYLPFPIASFIANHWPTRWLK